MGEAIRVGDKPSWLVAAAGSIFVTHHDSGTLTRIDAQSGLLVVRIRDAQTDLAARDPAGATEGAGHSWSAARCESAAQQGDRVTKGGVAGIGRFVASGFISDKGKVVVIVPLLPEVTNRRVISGGLNVR